VLTEFFLFNIKPKHYAVYPVLYDANRCSSYLSLYRAYLLHFKPALMCKLQTNSQFTDH